MEFLGKSFYLGICLWLERQHAVMYQCDFSRSRTKENTRILCMWDPCGWWEAAGVTAGGVSKLPLLCPDLVRRTCGKVDLRSTPLREYNIIRGSAQLAVSNRNGVSTSPEGCNTSAKTDQKGEGKYFP